ncbi:hypothetical protein [Micromonospora sp. B9E7]|uniref:hypothetical protein n=1 Tax=Micromonospora sp. B9E7 TaxID=3153574 RepID=UPI00325E87EA
MAQRHTADNTPGRAIDVLHSGLLHIDPTSGRLALDTVTRHGYRPQTPIRLPDGPTLLGMHRPAGSADAGPPTPSTLVRGRFHPLPHHLRSPPDRPTATPAARA